jgi:hypothetical protein
VFFGVENILFRRLTIGRQIFKVALVENDFQFQISKTNINKKPQILANLRLRTPIE